MVLKAGEDRFARFAWGVLAYNVLVVLWGAYVRATGSGAGCGSHWPLCNGEVLPRAPGAETIIEFTHRVTSGLALMAVAALVLGSRRLFPAAHRVRRFATLSAVFLVVEALLGAGLVLFRFVGQDASPGRAVYLAAHLVNTQVLLAMLAATAWFARGPVKTRVPAPARTVLFATLPVVLIVSATGAVAALGDTLREAPAILVRLRVLHPLVAVVSAVFILLALSLAGRAKHLKAPGALISFLVMMQLAAGAVNVALLAPVWMQIVHLLLANVLWIALVGVYLKASFVRVAASQPAAT